MSGRLDGRRKEVRDLFRKADAALEAGTITKRERDALLRHETGEIDERRALRTIDSRGVGLDGGDELRIAALVTVFAVVMVVLFAALFYGTGGVTGAVVFGDVRMNRTFADNGEPPLLVAGIPDIVGEGYVVVDLGPAFHDPDGNELSYGSVGHPGTNETIEGGILLIGGEPGTYAYIVYASDGENTIPSNMFAVTILPSASGSSLDASVPVDLAPR